MPETSTMFGTLSGELTERALRVLARAREEAQTLGYQFVSTEHLLLGVLAEGSGRGAELLVARGLKLDQARRLIERLVGRGPGLVPNEMPFTPRARYAWEIAYDESEQLKHRDMDSIHILFGVVRECLFAGKRGGGAASVFKSLDIELRELEIEILTALREYGAPQSATAAPLAEHPPVPETPVDIPPVVQDAQPAAKASYPTAWLEGEVRARLATALSSWVEEHDLGRVAVACPVVLAGGDTLQVDVLLISGAQLQRGGRIPELVALIAGAAVEHSALVEAKLQLLIAAGVRVGVAVYPGQVIIVQQDGERRVLSGTDVLEFPLLPGWRLPVECLWPDVAAV